MYAPQVLGIVLAGGQGKRLWPLTADRAKPAVPCGGNYRLVDFVLSNLVNAGIHRIYVLTQYKSHSLDRHIATSWRLSSMLGQFVIAVPAQQRLGPHWYNGSADAIFQSLDLVYGAAADVVAVFGADHVYRMDPMQMIAQHLDSGAGVTVAGIRVPRAAASAFGCIEADASGRILRFVEKPPQPPGIPDDPQSSFVSMGNYVFTTSVLLDALRWDADNPGSAHDMGGDIVPMLVEAGRAHVYNFSDNTVRGATVRDHGYWRDVGTLDAYYDLHLDLLSGQPRFNLFNHAWPIRTRLPSLPPAKFVAGGNVEDCIIGPGSVISGGRVRNSVLGPDVVVGKGAIVDGCVVLPGVRIGTGAIVRRAILDKDVVVDGGAQIGQDPDADAKSYTTSPCGITVIGKGTRVA